MTGATATGSFPLGCDYAWLATDSAGQLGVFINAGAGPIPARSLPAGPPPTLPKRSSANCPNVATAETWYPCRGRTLSSHLHGVAFSFTIGQTWIASRKVGRGVMNS